jgi:hypothetical protein
VLNKKVFFIYTVTNYNVIDIDYFVDGPFGVAAYEVNWSPPSRASATLPLSGTSRHP